MRSCPACGTANREDDEFCGNCGSYLGWSSRASRSTPAAMEPAGPSDPAGPAEPEAPAAEPATGAPAGPVTGTVPETEAPPATSPPAPRPEPMAEPVRTRAPEPAAPPPAVPATPAPAAAQPAPVRPEQPVRPAPVRPEPPAPDGPVVAVQPARPVARRPVVRPVTADEEPEGPPCPACGTPNLPGRRFCRRCAAPLQTSEQPAPLPWWRTVWPFRRRVRSGSGRVLRRTLLVLAVVGLLFVGFLLVPAGRYVFEDVRDKLGGTAEISPTGVTASAHTSGHPASAATDGLTNKYWGAPALGSSLTCTFDKPFRLVGVVVYTGVSTEPEEFNRAGRPTRAELIITKEGGDAEKKTVTLTDKPGRQTVRTGISDVVSVRLVLKGASGQGEGRPIAVGEIEFFKRT
ncbi:zinc ribbon domain-containing protein [Streptomyces sp. NBC_01435]|uniref:zinc ribbon domain-containing protein n=1 Tax=Streptomyces sp. NBC_01435 TaxID=2903865 RepID=UPI002E339153|nr:zinc-ribbon domain-containing protein [Streptomyces sp. NBC_01435]